MPDFSSSLYLGMQHGRDSLRPWEKLTNGKPAALETTVDSERVADRLARLQGCESGLLAPSTLHLFWDLFGILARRGADIYFDSGLYPIGRWGIERAAALGAKTKVFPQHDVCSLRRMLRRDCIGGMKPIIVADGFCPACGKAAPVMEYLACAREIGGMLVLDDTQALGILGHSPGTCNPYGRGGGGVLRWSGILNDPHVIVITSVAKGFGVPVALLSGSRKNVSLFEELSETRVHCSPPSMAAVVAAEHALMINRMHGDHLRMKLLGNVRTFRKRLAGVGITSTGGVFPVQTLRPVPETDAFAVHRQLLRCGIKTVLHGRKNGRDALVSFILTTLHTSEQIDMAVDVLCSITKAYNKYDKGGIYATSIGTKNGAVQF